jgi:CO/xanthine dehydrogenase FAD-binding subunit
MITIGEYRKPKSAAEAYALLNGEDSAAVIGGGTYLRLSSKRIGTAIDLSDAGLGGIRETDDTIEIGAAVTLGELTRSPIIQNYAGGMIVKAVSGVVGVQLRNLATVGGTVFGRFGFSELITCLLALDCVVSLHQGGGLPIEEFLKAKVRNDILTGIALNKGDVKAAYQVLKYTEGSFPVLAAAAARSEAGTRIAVGARPGVAALAHQAMDFLNNGEAGDEAAREAGRIASEEVTFGDDRKASAVYRRELCRTLVSRAVAEVRA